MDFAFFTLSFRVSFFIALAPALYNNIPGKGSDIKPRMIH